MRTLRNKGFTLVELVVVIGILAILIAITLVAINPYQQVNHANDVSAKAVAQDFVTASIDYLATAKKLPWDKDPACQAELNTPGQELSNMPSCTADLINNGKLEQQYANSDQAKEIYVTKCGNSAVLCYNPKTKTEYADAHYTKFGVNDPGCPGNGGPSTSCYWCKPVLNDPACLVNPTPTPTGIPTATPTITLTPTVTPTPTAAPTPTPDPGKLYGIGGYKLDDTKFLRTYAALSFTYPSFPPNYMVDVSFRPDFGGTTSSGFGYFVNGVPVTSDADTIFNVAYAADGNFGTLTSPAYADQVKLTQKHFSWISMPYYWSKYVNGCGKTIYWRVVGWPGDSTGLIGPTYTGTVDCTTKVGVQSSWTDVNGDGVVDYTDYIILALQTKLRYGGWQPPE